MYSSLDPTTKMLVTECNFIELENDEEVENHNKMHSV